MPRLVNVITQYEKNLHMNEPYIHGSLRRPGQTRAIWGSYPIDNTEAAGPPFPFQAASSSVVVSTANGEAPKSRFPFFDPEAK
mmetsp:Transcript_5313/g.10563  ORF Transcript_5313/g.10563 Transcript_5313/m.10563 type:complete len:83 (-) Transcript_5313:133-381(-)